MRLLSLLLGVALVGVVLWDAFETIVLPRTVSRRFRLARVYFRGTWAVWSAAGARVRLDATRERFLAVYGPLSLVGLIFVWAGALIAGFATLEWAAGSQLAVHGGVHPGFLDDLYMSGTTFFTIGLGDVYPTAAESRFLTILEGGTGFGFLALMISYFPVLYQSFSRRESRLTLLDAWAGSPPAAGEILRRLAEAGEASALQPFLKDWEAWSSDVLESHISYPIVAFFRSQHQRQSWVSALTSVLDVSALVMVGIDGMPAWQAHVTFAIARHAAVDLSQILGARPKAPAERLSAGQLAQLRAELKSSGLRLRDSPDADARLDELRRSYEPYVAGLSRVLLVPLPHWWHLERVVDNWQTSPRRDGGAHL